MLPIRSFAVAFIVAALGCGKQSAAPLSVSEYTIQQAADSIPLAMGAEVRVGTVWTSLTGVSNDSRCPRNVTCVWAGDAVASIVVHPPCYKEGCKAASMVLSLHTNLEPRSGEGWGHTVRLLSLPPEPLAGVATDPSRYVAWVRVTK